MGLLDNEILLSLTIHNNGVLVNDTKSAGPVSFEIIKFAPFARWYKTSGGDFPRKLKTSGHEFNIGNAEL